MATLTLEIPESLKDHLDNALASGPFKDRNALVLSLIESGLRVESATHARWRDRMDAMIDEALRDVERGDVHTCTPDDMVRLGRQYLADKRAKEGRS